MRQYHPDDGGTAVTFTAEHAWRITAPQAGDCLLFFDFDGTLAPVGDDPTTVRPVPQAVDALTTLAGLVQRVAIVSARPVEFLHQRFPAVADIDLYGLYGLEHRCGAEEPVTDPAALPWVPTMAELADQARAELPSDALVEYKRLSVALHYRTAPQLADVIEAWGRAQAELRGLRVQVGRMVIEIKPPVNRDKGMVVGEAIRSAGCAWYFGDDVSDLKAFGALRARAETDSDFFGVCVAVANPESGFEVSQAADLTVPSPEALGEFLTETVRRLRR